MEHRGLAAAIHETSGLRSQQSAVRCDLEQNGKLLSKYDWFESFDIQLEALIFSTARIEQGYKSKMGIEVEKQWVGEVGGEVS